MAFIKYVCKRNFTSQVFRDRIPSFGVLFDIDGVICRGSRVLPQAQTAFKYLTNEKGKFKVPTVFVTNAGNSLRYVLKLNFNV